VKEQRKSGRAERMFVIVLHGWLEMFLLLNPSSWLKVSTTPGNPGNFLEFEIAPGNTGNLLEFG